MLTDIRLAFRQIARYPAFSAAAILALAIGLAVNAVAFSAVNAFLFKERAGFDVEGAGRILVSGPGRTDEGVSTPEFERLSAALAGSLDLAVEGRTPLAWKHVAVTDTVWALLVSRSYFRILETRPLTGRLPNAGDTAEAPAAVVSERFWRERLGAADVSTLRLTLNGVEVPVVGVLPDSFDGPGGLYAPDLWVPFEARPTLRLPARLDRADNQWLALIARLAPGVTVTEANARLSAEAASLAREWPRTHDHLRVAFTLMRERVPELRLLARLAAAGMALVGIVLLLACFNVATLLVARAVERQREIAIRAAVGASRWRVLRQQVTEGLVLAGLAGAVALVVASWSQDLIGTFAIPMAMPQRVNVAPDRTVMGFVALMVIAAGLLPAIAPALYAIRLNLVRALSAQGHGGTSGRATVARRALMLAQVGGSTMFMVVAALFVQSFVWAGAADPGFETDHAIVLTVEPGAQGYEAERARLTIDRVLDAIRGIGGVSNAAAATRLPFYIGYPRLIEVAETAQPCVAGGCPSVATYGIGPGYFRTLGIPILRGRELVPDDAEVAIVNETFAERWFAGRDAVGQVVRLGSEGRGATIVGIARNSIWRGYAESPSPVLYVPMTLDDHETSVSIVARTTAAPAPLVAAVERAIRRVDSDLAIESLTTMQTRLQFPRWPMRSASKFFGACGVLALLLATVGLAALISHSVGQRTREFGVRLAVGATERQLLTDVLGSGLAIIAPGVVTGLAGAAALSRVMGSAIIGVDSSSPTTYLAVAVLQGAVALAACLAPAMRAARIDPVAALRELG